MSPKHIFTVTLILRYLSIQEKVVSTIYNLEIKRNKDLSLPQAFYFRHYVVSTEIENKFSKI